MPGPSNSKKQRKLRSKPQRSLKESKARTPSLKDGNDTSAPSSPSPQQVVTPPLAAADFAGTAFTTLTVFEALGDYSDPIRDVPSIRHDHEHEERQAIALKQPYIYDPGNGPRVRDTRAFLTSSYFAQKPALDDPLCAEFAQEEVLQMLMTILPDDLALMLWYNKSRATSRICPSCQRLYRLGDTLPPLIGENQGASPHLAKEQKISGLCSPLCFIAASLSYPNAITSAWGRMSDDMDDASWELLNTPDPSASKSPGNLEAYLSMLVRMTRLHDLGLAQLCLPDLDFDECVFSQNVFLQCFSDFPVLFDFIKSIPTTLYNGTIVYHSSLHLTAVEPRLPTRSEHRPVPFIHLSM